MVNQQLTRLRPPPHAGGTPALAPVQQRRAATPSSHWVASLPRVRKWLRSCGTPMCALRALTELSAEHGPYFVWPSWVALPDVCRTAVRWPKLNTSMPHPSVP